jgi:hypothetical protein
MDTVPVLEPPKIEEKRMMLIYDVVVLTTSERR